MTTTESLTSDQICDIIKSCSKNGVSKLQFRDLELEFTQSSKQEEQIVQVPAQDVAVRQPESLIEKKNRLEREREDLISDAMIADPGLYERLIEEDEINAGRIKAEVDQRPERGVA